MKKAVFVFGEAERGEYCKPILCSSILHLFDHLGNPPESTEGIAYAVQFLSFSLDLLFFRVEEEGFSEQDYQHGLKLLRRREIPLSISGICMPGVGNGEIIQEAASICSEQKSILILSPKDLYDFLMSP